MKLFLSFTMLIFFWFGQITIAFSGQDDEFWRAYGENRIDECIKIVENGDVELLKNILKQIESVQGDVRLEIIVEDQILLIQLQDFARKKDWESCALLLLWNDGNPLYRINDLCILYGMESYLKSDELSPEASGLLYKVRRKILHILAEEFSAAVDTGNHYRANELLASISDLSHHFSGEDIANPADILWAAWEQEDLSGLSNDGLKRLWISRECVCELIGINKDLLAHIRDKITNLTDLIQSENDIELRRPQRRGLEKKLSLTFSPSVVDKPDNESERAKSDESRETSIVSPRYEDKKSDPQEAQLFSPDFLKGIKCINSRLKKNLRRKSEEKKSVPLSPVLNPTEGPVPYGDDGNGGTGELQKIKRNKR